MAIGPWENMSNSWRSFNSIDGSDPNWPRGRLRALAYLTGALLKGDASSYTTTVRAMSSEHWKRYVGYRLELKNISIGFMQSFNRACTVVLNRKAVKVHGPYADGHYILQYYAKDFVTWWKTQTLSTLRKLIEAFPVDYLRGRFDSDCSVGTHEVELCGAEAHRNLMEFERSICIELGMRTGRLRQCGKIGEETLIGKKRVVTTQRKLRFSVNTLDFLRVVGKLNVEWRNRKLQERGIRRAWTPWEAEVRKQAIQLRTTSGWGYKQIADALSDAYKRRLPPTTVYGWVNRSGVSWGEYSRR